MKRFFSHSEMYLWQRDRDKYIQQYVNGVEFEKTREMKLGTIIHSAIENKKWNWIKEMKDQIFGYDDIHVVRKLLNKVKRPPQSEVTLMTTGHEPELIAIFDGFDKDKKILYEFKTSKTDWTQYRVDTNTQLSFYAYVYQKIYHQYFSDIVLYSLNTERGTIKTFRTARGPKDIWEIGKVINDTYKQMQAAGIWEKRLSRKDKILQLNPTLF